MFNCGIISPVEIQGSTAKFKVKQLLKTIRLLYIDVDLVNNAYCSLKY